MHGPTIKAASSRAVNDRARVDFKFPVGISGEWSWSATMSVEDAERFAEDVHAAVHVARVVKQKTQQSADKRGG